MPRDLVHSCSVALVLPCACGANKGSPSRHYLDSSGATADQVESTFRLLTKGKCSVTLDEHMTTVQFAAAARPLYMRGLCLVARTLCTNTDVAINVTAQVYL